MKKILALVLLCALLPLGLPALSAQPFTFDADTGTITGYTGTDAVVEVPAAIDGVPVRALRAAFDQNRELREVILPEGLTHLLGNAFYFCENLEKVTLPSSLQAIDGYAFFSCAKLTEITLPPALVFVDDQAFGNCGALSEVRFTGGVPFVGKKAFEYGPENRRFVVPTQLQEAYQAALNTPCEAQGDAVIMPPSQDVAFDPARGAVTGYLAQSADVSIPAAIDGVAVQSIDDNAFLSNPWLRRLALPQGLTRIGEKAFVASRLAVVQLPDTLVEVGRQAFFGAPLKVLELPGSLTKMGPLAFASGKFTEVRVPDGITHIPEKAFQACWELEDLTLPAGLQSIDTRAFEDCSKLDYLVFEGDTPPTIAPDAFADCKSIEDIDILWAASKAQAEAFRQAFLQAGVPEDQLTVWRANPPDQPPYPVEAEAKFTFDEATQLVTSYEGTMDAMTMYWNFWRADGSEQVSIKGLAPGVFEGSTLRTFSVPHSNSFETIGDRAFANSALESIYLFDSVTHIGNEAFKDCVHLKQVTLPDSVETIGEGAFAGCTALENVVFKGQTIRIGAGAFAGCDQLESLVLPAAAVPEDGLGLAPEKVFVAADATGEQLAALQQALQFPWYLDLPREGETGGLVTMPAEYVPNPESEFEFDAATGTITAYKGSSPMVVVPRTIGGVEVTAIDYPGFSNLTVFSVLEGTQDNVSLQRVVLPETIRRIGDSAFLSCASLERVDCYGPVDLVGIRAFEECGSLKEVVFHNGVKELGIYCFNMCESLHTVALGSRMEELAEGAFWGCGFEKLVLDIPVIGNMAYTDCAKVTTIRVTPRVRSLGAGAFGGMTELETVYFERPEPDIIVAGTAVFDPGAINLRVILPGSATEEQRAGFVQRLKASMLPGDDMVVVDPSMPAGDVSQEPEIPQAAADTPLPAEATPPPEQPAPEPEVTAEAPTPAPAAAETPAQSGAGIAFDTTYRAVSAVASGVPVDIAALGLYEARFSGQGTAEITLGDVPVPPLPYLKEGDQFVIDLGGQRLIFTPQEDGLQLDFYGTMLLTMKPAE